jgi:hypothetical protein
MSKDARPRACRPKRISEEHWDRWFLGRGDARRVISPFGVRPRFVVLSRVSTSDQRKKRNLASQRKLKTIVERLGATVVDVKEHEWSGRDPEWDFKLREAADLAREHRATLLAFATDRFKRHRHFRANHPTWSKAQASETDLHELEVAVGNYDRVPGDAGYVELMTYMEPNATPAELRRVRSEWGQETKGDVGGRPTIHVQGKRLTDLWVPVAVRLRSKGWKPPRIARYVSKKFRPITREAVWKMLKKVSSYGGG